MQPTWYPIWGMFALKNNYCDLREVHEPRERAGGSLAPSWKWTQGHEHPAQVTSRLPSLGRSPCTSGLVRYPFWTSLSGGDTQRPSCIPGTGGCRVEGQVGRGGGGCALHSPHPVRSPEGWKEGQLVG